MADHGAATNAPHFIVLATPQASSRMNDGHSVRDEIQSFGFNDVFEKPVNRQALINRIRVIAVQRAMRPSNVGPMPRAEPPVHCSALPLDGVVAAESASRLDEAVGEIRCRLDSHCQRLFAIAQMLREMADDIASVAAETSPAAAPERCHADVAGAIVD